MPPRDKPRQTLAACLRLAGAIRRFHRAQNGVAAVEFALVLPVMILMYLGMTEVTMGLNTDRKLTLLSRSLADLTARATSVSTTDINNIFAASTAVLQPYDSSKASMVLTSILVTTDSGGKPVGKVDWSCAQLTSDATIAKRAKGSTYLVPDGFKDASSFILVETTYKYVPVLGGRFTQNGIYNLSETTPWPVRNTSQVSFTGSSC